MAPNRDNTTVRRVAAWCGLCALATVAANPRAWADWPFETNQASCGETVPTGQFDAAHDRSIRRTDTGADGALNLGQHRVPELIGLRAARFAPADPMQDLFTGCWSASGLFLRIELLVSGLVNPPGPVGLSTPDYDPYRYGPHPIIGFFEFDVDSNVNSGGNAPNPENSYVANIARFGGIPSFAPLHDRVALGGWDIDGTFDSPPFVERSGEDFHVALFGDLVQTTTVVAGNDNGVFEAGERWVIRGTLLHRSHGYEIFSSAGTDGSYEPVVDLEFRHSVDLDATLISLVYPLSNAGSAAITGQVASPPDGNPFNQNSILEGLIDLQTSVYAIQPGSPLYNDSRFALIAPWLNANPADYLDPSAWRITVLIGMPYVLQDNGGAFAAWTDAWPSVRPGDFDGDGEVTMTDVATFDEFLTQWDGQFHVDGDNVFNGRVTLSNFGPNFSVYDLTHDGRVDAQDRASIARPGDLDGDLDIDIEDAAGLAALLLNPGAIQGCGVSTAGACCLEAPFGPALCLDATAEDCQMQGGTFGGVGTRCQATDCSGSLGACCVALQGLPVGCFDARGIDCALAGGIFLGAGTSCADGITSTLCEGPDALGACCFNSPILGICEELSQTQCAQQGGAYYGVGVPCSADWIPCTHAGETWACCLPSGACSLISELNCLQQGGFSSPGIASCGSVDCPSPANMGACCASDGIETVCFELDGGFCALLGGSYFGDGTSCANTECGNTTLRACCFPDGSCEALDLATCVAFGGGPQPIGTTCATAQCTVVADGTGACCVTVGGLSESVCIETAELDCLFQEGTFFGDGTTCSEFAPACVSFNGGPVPIGQFVEVLLHGTNDALLFERVDYTGDGLVDGRDILGFVDLVLFDPAATYGACCIQGGGANFCVMSPQTDCGFLGGTYLGTGTVCDGSCGAATGFTFGCCAPGGACIDMLPGDCAAAGGASDPDALTCDERAQRIVYPRADVTGDGALDGRDVQGFIEALGTP